MSDLTKSALHLGDCVAGLRSLPDASVDHFITDPPYSEHTQHRSRRRVMDAVSREDAMLPNDLATTTVSKGRAFGFEPLTDDLLGAVAAEIGRLARRWVLVFCDFESTHLWREALTDAGLEYIRTGIFVKTNAAPQFSGDRPASPAEAIVIAHATGKKRWNGGGRHALWEASNVLNRSHATPGNLHPAQKPLPLMTALVEQFTDRGDLICDPFAGSGTTLVAAKREGRRYLGWEQQQQWYDVARRRLDDTAEQLSIGAIA